MTHDEAYEMASRQGFEGTIYFSQEDGGVGRVDSVKITLDEEDGTTSLWWAEVSEANGCEGFGKWTANAQQFFAEQMAIRKAARKPRRKAPKA